MKLLYYGITSLFICYDTVFTNKKTPSSFDKRGISNTILSYFITCDADEARFR